MSTERRRRRENVADGPRVRSHRVRVSEAEEARLVVLAERADVTVPRLLVEAALADSAVSASELRDVALEVREARRLLGANARNLNQMTRWMNEQQQVHADTQWMLSQTRRAYEDMHQAVERIIAVLAAS